MSKAAKSDKPQRVVLTTPVFVMSFPNLFKARKASDDAEPKFGCAAIWTPANFTAKEKELYQAILRELNKEALRAFNKKYVELPDNVRRAIRNGNAKEGLAGYGEGTRFANLTSKNPIGVVDINRNDISPEDGNAQLVYPGVFARARVQVYSYGGIGSKGAKGKGVMLGLRNIQIVKDGPRLDNRVAAKDDFDEELESKWLDDADEDSGFEGGDDNNGDDEIPF